VTVRIPIPVFSAGKAYGEVDLGVPDAGTLADTRRALDDGNYFQAIHEFLRGCVEAIREEGGDGMEGDQARAMVKHIPIRSAELLAIQAMLLIDADEGIEGVYDCPRCGKSQIAEYRSEDSDSRDRISDLGVAYMDGEREEAFSVSLAKPVTMKDKSSGEAVYSASEIEMSWPTLGHAMSSYGKYGASDRMRRQFAIYIEATRKVNGEEVSAKWRGEYGMFTFEKMKVGPGGLGKIGREMERYGMKDTIPKTCPSCGKKWEAEVNTSNFFASALPSV